MLQHIFDALLRFRRSNQFKKVLAFQVRYPVLVHHAARLDITAAHDLGDAVT